MIHLKRSINDNIILIMIIYIIKLLIIVLIYLKYINTSKIIVINSKMDEYMTNHLELERLIEGIPVPDITVSSLS